jgi:hypothetical protein
MATVQIADVIVPSCFSNYVVENSMTSCSFFQSGVAVPNSLMAAELAASSQSLQRRICT